MNKIVRNMVLVAAAAMGFTACQEEIQNDGPLAEETIKVTFVAQSADTKTSVDTSGELPKFSWGENETFAVLEQTDALAKATSVTYAKVDGKANITAEFAANSGKEQYAYATVYPESGFDKAGNINDVTLSLPAVQTMVEGSYDPDADLMVSEVVTTAAQPTEAQMVRFTRLAAVAKMTINNLTLAEGDQIEQVIFTAEGKNLAGTVTADLADPHETLAVAEGVNNVTVNTKSSTDVYFTVLPTTLGNGEACNYTVTVLTKTKIYIKEGTIPAEKTLAFVAGKVTRFDVNMANVAPSDKWVLVKDASTLKQGDVVTIAAKNSNYILGADMANNYPYASETEVVKIGDYLYHPDGDQADNMVQKFTLVKRDAASNAFDFYNGNNDYEGDEDSGFLWAPDSGSKYLKLQGYYSSNTQFDVTIDDAGEATVIATYGTGSSKQIMYNSSTYASSRYFHCYSEITDAKKICIYRQEGAVGTIPVVAANVTVPDSDESVVFAEEGAAEPTAIDEVVFNYVGDWTITPSTNAQWLTVAYDAANKCLTYTAEANTGAKREISVTITATLEGQESLSWTFNVLQKGVPQEISIADFMTKGQDVNVTYKITGRITEKTTSSDGTFKLTDGINVATVTYLYTDAGTKVSGDNSIGLEVGDVVTVTTVVTSTTKGKGGSSSYHSIYKGHYGLKASAGVAAEYTGGSVAIEVTTKNNGNIVLPEAVTAVMTENDFAELSYNGGDQATVTFASENTTSDAREAEVTFTYGQTSVVVTVQQGVNPANKKGYELVTDASTLAIGDEVIIVALKADKAIACPTSTSATSFPAATIEKTGNVIYDIEDAGVQVFTLSAGVSEGTMAFDFTYKDTGYRLYYSSGLKMRATSYAINAATSWTIDINNADGDATITSTRLIKFNSTGGTTFTAYATTNANATKAENAICIYKKQK